MTLTDTSSVASSVSLGHLERDRHRHLPDCSDSDRVPVEVRGLEPLTPCLPIIGRASVEIRRRTFLQVRAVRGPHRTPPNPSEPTRVAVSVAVSVAVRRSINRPRRAASGWGLLSGVRSCRSHSQPATPGRLSDHASPQSGHVIRPVLWSACSLFTGRCQAELTTRRIDSGSGGADAVSHRGWQLSTAAAARLALDPGGADTTRVRGSERGASQCDGFCWSDCWPW